MKILKPDVATRTASNRSEVDVIQSVMFKLLLKHKKYAKNDQTLQAMSQKQDFQKKHEKFIGNFGHQEHG